MSLPAGIPSRALPAVELKGCKILIADPDEFSVRVLSRILTREGYVLGSAGSGKRTLALYPEFRPDLVLIDKELNGLDGLQTCRVLKETYGAQCAAIVFLTARAASEDIVAGLDAGAADYLRKPYNRLEVVARIRVQLRNRLLVARQASIVAELSRANAEKNRFLSLAAHDLRNPLASINHLARYLRDGTVGPVSADQLDLIETICTTGFSMLGMVNELLDVVTIESGELKLHLEPTNLTVLLEKSVHVAHIDAARKKSRVIFTAPEVVTVAEIDAAKMKQIVDNLLSNAVKYSPPGSTITAAIQSGDDGKGRGFAVRDQGPGIPEGERDRLFKDFGRLTARPTGGEKSTGLGLAICRKIAEAHGATITARNLPEGGCEFRVTFAPAP